MATIRQIRDNFKLLNLDKSVMDTVMQHSQEITDLNRKQLTYGTRSSGKRIGQYKNERYKAKKLAMNPLASGNIDLILNGDYSNMINLRRDSDKVAELFSEDEKANMLKAEYGDDILGLSNSSIYELVNDTTFQDAFVLKLKQALKLK